MNVLRVGTRRSALALWQAHKVRELLLAAGVPAVQLVELVTSGDRITDRPLSQVGGKGLFVKELEDALLGDRCDLAVHSAKDVPGVIPDGLTLVAFPLREDPRDALVAPAHRTLSALPRGARLGTSSLRRSCLLRVARPDLEIRPVRGNVETRLAKGSDPAQLDGVVLALAGLRRLGLEARVTEILALDVSLPAAGQGALAIETRVDGPGRDWAAKLDDAAIRAAVLAERAAVRVLEGSCTVPIGAHALREGETLWLRAFVGTPDGARVIRSEARGLASDAVALGRRVGDDLVRQGALEIL